MKRMKLLHLHSTFNLGGKEARAVRLMNAFGGHASHAILSAEPEALSAREQIHSEIKVRFPGEDAPPLHGKPALDRYRKFATYFQQFDLILSYNWGSMDGVMAHNIFSRSMALPPLIHHEDGFNEDEREKLNWKRNLFRRLALGKSFGMAVPSRTLEDIARKIWKQHPAKIHRISNGIDLKPFAAAPRSEAIPGFTRKDDEIIVGTLAGLRTIKNLPRLLRACAGVQAKIRLIIVGEGPERAAIEEEARRLDFADQLVLPGFLSKPSSYVGLFDIFALSSDSEQFPISMVEAMAAGLPVVSTDVGDVRSIISPANLAFISPVDQEQQMAENITVLAQDKTLRGKIGAANRKLAHAEYGAEKMIEKYRSFYAEAMGVPNFAR